MDERSEDLALHVPAKHPLGTLDIFPTEIICEIISWASIPVPDVIASGLYTLTRVSKAMASLTLPQHLEINTHRLPTLGLYYIGLNGDQFSLFPAWVRSEKFTSREEVSCHFASPNTNRKIGALGVGLSCMRPADRPKSLEFNGDLDLTQALSLLDMAGRARVQSVELDVFQLDWSTQAIPAIPAPERVIHKLAHLETLRIEWPSLLSDNWRPLLEAIAAPKLKALTLRGGVPWSALISFLARHTTISQLNLPASDITRIPRRHHTLHMPQLHLLEGKQANVNSLLNILTYSTITSIQEEIPSNTSLVQTVNAIITSLAACNSKISLTTNLTSTKPNGPLTQIRRVSARTLQKWHMFPDRLAQLRQLHLKIVGMDDSILLVSLV